MAEDFPGIPPDPQLQELAAGGVEQENAGILELPSGQRDEPGAPVDFPLPASEVQQDDFVPDDPPQEALGAEPLEGSGLGFDASSSDGQQLLYPDGNAESGEFQEQQTEADTEQQAEEEQPRGQEFTPEDYITGVQADDSDYNDQLNYQPEASSGNDMNEQRESPFESTEGQVTSEDTESQGSSALHSQEPVSSTETEPPQEYQPTGEASSGEAEEGFPVEPRGDYEEQEQQDAPDQPDGSSPREEALMETEDSDKQQFDMLDIIKDIDEFNRIADPGGAAERPTQVQSFQGMTQREEEDMETESPPAEVQSEGDQGISTTTLSDGKEFGAPTDDSYDEVDAQPDNSQPDNSQQAGQDEGPALEEQPENVVGNSPEGIFAGEISGDIQLSEPTTEEDCVALTDQEQESTMVEDDIAPLDEEALLASPGGKDTETVTETSEETPQEVVTIPTMEDGEGEKGEQGELQDSAIGQETEQPGEVHEGTKSGEEQMIEIPDEEQETKGSDEAQDTKEQTPEEPDEGQSTEKIDEESKESSKEAEPSSDGAEKQMEVKEEDGIEGLQITAVQGAVEIPSGEEKQEEKPVDNAQELEKKPNSEDTETTKTEMESTDDVIPLDDGMSATEPPTPVAMTENTANPAVNDRNSGQSPSGKPSKTQECIVCKKVGKCKYNIVRNGDIKHLCDDACFKVFRASPSLYLQSKGAATTTSSSSQPPAKASTALSCTLCQVVITPGKDKLVINIPGKESKQFCSVTCREQYRKKQKFCTQCKIDIMDNPQAFMAPISDGSFKDFCSQTCLQTYEKKQKSKKDDDIEFVGTSKTTPKPTTPRRKEMAKCSVCGKTAQVKHEINQGNKTNKLCSDPCFAAYRYANKLTMNSCENCGMYCYSEGSNPQTIQHEGQCKRFCSSQCVKVFKSKKQRIVACAWCGVKKPNFDMIERVDANNKYQLFCTLNCLSLYRVNLQATSNQNIGCDQCHKLAPAQYHLTMSDASVRNFCSYNCVMTYQGQFSQPKSGQQAPSGGAGAKQSAPSPQIARTGTSQPQQILPQPPDTARQSTRQSTRVATRAAPGPLPQTSANVPVISNVMSLASGGTAAPAPAAKVNTSTPTSIQAPVSLAPAPATTTTAAQTLKQKIIVQPPAPKTVKNKSLLCKPFVQTKATSCKPHTQAAKTQTEEDWSPKQVLVPVPVPIYVPVPVRAYTTPIPYPLPIPVPIPVPCFIPTTRKSADGILKQIKEIQEKMPADPFEAELLMMAETLAGGDPESSTDEEDDEKPDITSPSTGGAVSGTPSIQQNEPGEDILQIAIRMASEMPDEPLDVEDSLNPTPINPSDPPPPHTFATIDQDSDLFPASREATRGRGRGKRSRGGGTRGRKKQRLEPEPEPQPMPQQPVIPQPPADANMVLKFTYGVNAWKHWVIQKNAQVEKSGSASKGRLKLFKTDIMQCTADELNYSLCLFVKEVRKPNGEEYAPDSIFYLCLGIQQYLLENGRIDNIFSDIYYEGFTEHLNEILSHYEVRLNAQGLIVCRIEEEHLWESKQLGAHSPHVLLNTLIYFNTKFFMLKTPEEHLRLSFSHIMKHWKKTNMPGTKTPGRSVYLRYYAPVNTGNEQQKRKREEMPVFEQAENAENPLRCPVKLYEFYLSKCPESIKNRNDVFYLIPERSCVPDSPVWYSTGSLGIEAMTKMLNRLRVVREIQEAHLHFQPYYVTS